MRTALRSTSPFRAFICWGPEPTGSAMSMFNFKRREEGTAKGPRGYSAYAIGDVHGRLDLLDRLLADIERDRIENPARKVLLVFLGDLIDRGPQSAQVIERLRS